LKPDLSMKLHKAAVADRLTPFDRLTYARNCQVTRRRAIITRCLGNVKRTIDKLYRTVVVLTSALRKSRCVLCVRDSMITDSNYDTIEFAWCV
jgi:hypothetical protein